jgi:hypothetical protein
MNETDRILEELKSLDCEQLETVLMGLLTYIDDISPTNFSAETFCYHLRSAVVALQQRTGN